MLSDNFPVFNIDLDIDFESSDHKFPPFHPSVKVDSNQLELNHQIQRDHNILAFTTIGRRNANLDRYSYLQRDKFTAVAVYDGHCNQEVAQYLKSYLLIRLVDHPNIITQTQSAILEGAFVFQEMEKQVVKMYQKGSTALVAIIFPDSLVIANLGDSKAFGVGHDQSLNQLNKIHNLTNSCQLMDVISRGGIVLKKGNKYRINGQMNLSRCFGDKNLKHCMSKTPDIYRYQAEDYQKIVIATDGFYNAAMLKERIEMNDPQEFKDLNITYEDNATAIYFFI